MRDIYIVGTGGTSREVADVIDAVNRIRSVWNVLGFLDDNAELHGATVYGIPVLGDLTQATRSETHAAVAIGVTNDRRLLVRKEIRQRLSLGDDRLPAIIHPSASISPKAVTGAGSIILAGVRCSGQTCLGAHVVVLQNTVIAHDVNIAPYASVAASVVIGGNVTIGEGAYIGQGAMLFPGIRIGAQSKIGMGAVVLRDVPDGATVVGNPGRILRKKDTHPCTTNAY